MDNLSTSNLLGIKGLNLDDIELIFKTADNFKKIINADLTLICEKPKISPFKEQMVRCVADLLHLEPSQVNVLSLIHI